MIFLYIFLSILSLIFILLLIPVRLDFKYGQEVTLTVRYAFLKMQLLPEKEKTEEPEKPEEQKKAEGKPKENKIKKLLKEKGLGGFLKLVKELMGLVTRQMIKIIKHIKIRELDIYAVAGGENAADAAMLYGEACAVIYPAVNTIASLCNGKKCRATVDLDYKLEEARAIATASVSLCPIFAATHGLKLIIKAIPYIKEFR